MSESNNLNDFYSSNSGTFNFSKIEEADKKALKDYNTSGFLWDSPKTTGEFRKAIENGDMGSARKAIEQLQNNYDILEKQYGELWDTYKKDSEEYGKANDNAMRKELDNRRKELEYKESRMNNTKELLDAFGLYKKDATDGLMEKYEKFKEQKRQAVENRDEKAYAEASKGMHDVADTYEKGAGYNFRMAREERKTGFTSKYGKNSRNFVKFAALNPDSPEAGVLESIANENDLANNKQRKFVENLKEHGFDDGKIQEAAQEYAAIKTKSSDIDSSVKDIAKIELGTKTEAYEGIKALQKKANGLKGKKNKNSENLSEIELLKQENLTNYVEEASKKFKENFGEDISQYEKKVTKESAAEFRRRMNKKISPWGKIGKTVIASTIALGTLATAIGGNRGQQSNSQLYGQQPIY